MEDVGRVKWGKVLDKVDRVTKEKMILFGLGGQGPNQNEHGIAFDLCKYSCAFSK
jgi:hypothetical protein